VLLQLQHLHHDTEEMRKLPSIVFFTVFLLYVTNSGLSGQGETRILFDEYHSFFMLSKAFIPPSIPPDFLSELEIRGYSVEFSNEKISSSVLSDYDVLVEIMPWKNFNTGEKEAIKTFVENGGGLLILGEDGTEMRDRGIIFPINSISTMFGIEFNVDLVQDPENHWKGFGDVDHYVVISRFKHHEVTQGIQNIVYFGGCSLDIDLHHSSATGLAFGNSTTTTNGQQGKDVVMLAAAEYGKGNVLAFGDSDLLVSHRMSPHGPYPQNILTIEDNKKLMLNMLQWLASPEVDIEEAEDLASQGYVLFSQRKYSRAKVQAGKALEIYSEADNDQKVCEMQRFIDVCDKALDAAVAFDEGMDYYQQGAFENALIKFKASKLLYDEIGDAIGAGKAQSMIDQCSAAFSEVEESGIDTTQTVGKNSTIWMLVIAVLAVAAGSGAVVVKIYLGKSRSLKKPLDNQGK
jgi:hypothetical protein